MPDEQTLRLPLRVVETDFDCNIVDADGYVPAAALIVAAVNEAPVLRAAQEREIVQVVEDHVETAAALVEASRRIEELTAERDALVEQNRRWFAQMERAEARVTELTALLERLSQADALGVTPDASYWRMVIRDAVDMQAPAAERTLTERVRAHRERRAAMYGEDRNDDPTTRGGSDERSHHRPKGI